MHPCGVVLSRQPMLELTPTFTSNKGYPTTHFDMDSVELITMMNELREGGMPFWIGAAVSPFKYTEADCAYQYLKLEKKFAAGADYAITQLGFDVRKFAELRRYLNEHGVQKPVIGNVYVLGLKASEKMSKGEPPGCWVAPELVERIREEVKASDKGEAARLERAARMAAILRGLGYAGAYIGGTHKAEHVRWIIDRGQQLAPQWEELAKEFTYAPKTAFYMYEPSNAPAANKGQRIPEPQLREHFGREHTFVINRPVIIENRPRFQFASYWFEIVSNAISRKRCSVQNHEDGGRLDRSAALAGANARARRSFG